MKICTCESCHYTFRYSSRKQCAKDAARSMCPTFCPDCGKKTIRIANRKEISEYYKSQAILAEDIRMGLYCRPSNSEQVFSSDYSEPVLQCE